MGRTEEVISGGLKSDILPKVILGIKSHLTKEKNQAMLEIKCRKQTTINKAFRAGKALHRAN